MVTFADEARRRFSNPQITIALCLLIVIASGLLTAPFAVLRAILVINLAYATGLLSLRLVAISNAALAQTGTSRTHHVLIHDL